jgi:hypothetical protein
VGKLGDRRANGGIGEQTGGSAPKREIGEQTGVFGLKRRVFGRQMGVFDR